MKGGRKIKRFILFLILIVFLTGCSNIQDEIKEELKESYEVKRIREYENRKVSGVYIVKNKTNINYLVQLVESEGYKGSIYILTFIDIKKDKLEKVEIYKHNETPSYGGYIEEDWFLKKFKDKDVKRNLKLVKMSAKKENEIVAVTGATVSSNGVVVGVNICFENYFNNIKGELK